MKHGPQQHPDADGKPVAPLIEVSGLVKQYPGQDQRTLNDLSFQVFPGEFIALMGPSGCGKSTLLNILGGLDQASEGRVVVAGLDLTRQDDARLTRFRRETLGFVFQFFNLLNTLSVAENIALPLELAGKDSAEAITYQVSYWLERVHLTYRAHAYPAQISGGEMQRTAIARALVHRPQLILADEPTGNLDTDTGLQVLTLLKTLCREHGQTVVMATHSEEAARRFADRVLRIRDGRLLDSVAIKP